MQQQGWVSSWPHEWLLEYLCCLWSVAVPACLTSHTFAAVLQGFELVLNCFSFGFLFVFKIFPCLYSTRFLLLPHLCLIQTCPVTVLSGRLSPFSLGHLFSFCSYSPGCCFSRHLLLSLVTLSSIILLHSSFHHAASVVPGFLYGDFILKVI